MINLKRFPGVVFRYRNRLVLAAILAFLLVYSVYRWGFVCTNNEINKEIEKLCQSYKNGEAVGSLCKPLCVNKQIHSVSCISKHSKKQFVFTAKWNKRLIVIKSSITKELRLKNGDSEIRGPEEKTTIDDREWTETSFEAKIKRIVSERLNMTLTRTQLDELKFLDVKNKALDLENSKKRKVEKENVFALLQSQEYLLSRLFSDRELFPKILGTCGNVYGVEYLERPNFSSIFTLDEKAEWSERMKLAVAIMDFVEEVETNFPDALHLCDVRMNHLGITQSGRIKFLDLDLAFLKNVVDKILRSGEPCEEHKDCDLFDCKSTCKKKICDSGVVNDNLQVICEKIFIGWTMSGKMIVPGLLMSEYTPASLSALLRLCAENRREPVHEDLRQRLYTTLTEMHQILIQKILAE